VAAATNNSWSIWPAELNIVTIRIPPVKASVEDQSIQWTLRNDTTAAQLLSSLCEVSKSAVKYTACHFSVYLVILFPEIRTSSSWLFLDVKNCCWKRNPM